MSAPRKREARCACGQVTVETEGEPGAVVMCHCLDCQRRTGSAFGLGAYFSPGQVRISGATLSFARPTDSGERFLAQFCPKCGTSISWKMDPDDGRVGVAVGAFADPSFPAPSRSVWERSRHEWVNVGGIGEHFPKGRGQ